MAHSVEVERQHQDAWYGRALDDRFFAREGFRQLVQWNTRAFMSAVPLHAEMKLVSLGCGLGEYELLIAPHVREILAVDLSARAVEEAQRRARVQGIRNVTFRQGTVTEVELGRATVDAVYGFGLLHHLDAATRTRVYESAHQWLVPGGSFYARDPNARSILRRVATLGGLSKTRFHSPDEAALDPRGIERELTGAGFRHIAVSYTDVIGGPLPWLLSTSSPVFWRAVFGFDRLWLAVPGLRQFASQFSVTARR